VIEKPEEKSLIVISVLRLEDNIKMKLKRKGCELDSLDWCRGQCGTSVKTAITHRI
jgi:hypothetical protein